MSVRLPGVRPRMLLLKQLPQWNSRRGLPRVKPVWCVALLLLLWMGGGTLELCAQPAELPTEVEPQALPSSEPGSPPVEVPALVPTAPDAGAPTTPAPAPAAGTVPPPARTPQARLQEAIRAYENGGYLAAATQLSALLYPLKLTLKADILQAKIHLGMSYYVLGRKEESTQEFKAVFRLDPTFKPDPLKVPPELVAFIEAQRPPPPRTSPVAGLGEQLPPALPPPGRFQVLNLVPAGVPQLANGDYARGVTLATLQATLLTTNIASYWYLKQRVVEAPDEVLYGQLQAAKVINISSLGLLLATMVLGTGDALYRYRGTAGAPMSRIELRLEPGGLSPELAKGLASPSSPLDFGLSPLPLPSPGPVGGLWLEGHF